MTTDHPAHEYHADKKWITAELKRMSAEVKYLGERNQALQIEFASMKGKIIAVTAVLSIIVPILVTWFLNNVSFGGQ